MTKRYLKWVCGECYAKLCAERGLKEIETYPIGNVFANKCECGKDGQLAIDGYDNEVRK